MWRRLSHASPSDDYLWSRLSFPSPFLQVFVVSYDPLSLARSRGQVQLVRHPVGETGVPSALTPSWHVNNTQKAKSACHTQVDRKAQVELAAVSRIGNLNVPWHRGEMGISVWSKQHLRCYLPRYLPRSVPTSSRWESARNIWSLWKLWLRRVTVVYWIANAAETYKRLDQVFYPLGSQRIEIKRFDP